MTNILNIACASSAWCCSGLPGCGDSRRGPVVEVSIIHCTSVVVQICGVLAPASCPESYSPAELCELTCQPASS